MLELPLLLDHRAVAWWSPPAAWRRSSNAVPSGRARRPAPGRALVESGGRFLVKTAEEDPHRGHRRPSLDGPAVIAYVAEDDQYAEVRHAAEVHAKVHGCTLILYAADVASILWDPMPNQWDSEGEAEQFGDRLSPEDLDFLGRSAIAGQVREGRRDGVIASAWLPKDKGIVAFAEYAAAQGAHVIFVPESLASIDELRALLATGSARETARPAVKLQVVRPPDSAMPSSASGDPGSEPS